MLASQVIIAQKGFGNINMETQRDFGCYRDVIISGDYVFKFPHNQYGNQCNMREYKVWTESNEEQRVKLCPVVSILMDGAMLIMKRAKTLKDMSYEEFSDLVYSIPGEDKYETYKGLSGDLHLGNFGILDDSRVVLVDYGDAHG